MFNAYEYETYNMHCTHYTHHTPKSYELEFNKKDTKYTNNMYNNFYKCKYHNCLLS